jgi:hypothetical protein
MSVTYAAENERAVFARPDATPAQWAAFTEFVMERAPDLAPMLLGEAA